MNLRWHLTESIDQVLAAARYLWLRHMLLPPPATFLEIGIGYWQASECASGDLDPETCDMHCDGYGNAGVEGNPEHAVIAAGIRPNDRVVTLDIGTDPLPFHTSSYATVMCPEVLEHLDREQWDFAVAECWRVAARQLLITIPYVAETQIDPPFDRLDFPQWDRHRWLPCPEDMLAVLHDACPDAVGETCRVVAGHFLCAQIVKRAWW